MNNTNNIQYAAPSRKIQQFLVTWSLIFHDVLITPRSSFDGDRIAKSAYGKFSLSTIVFGTLSLGISTTIGVLLVPTDNTTSDFSSSAINSTAYTIFMLIAWIVFSSMYYILSRIIGGNATFPSSLSSSFCTKGVIYLFSTFVVVGLGGSASMSVFASAASFAFLDAILTVIYITIIFSALNKFRLTQTIIFSLGCTLIQVIPVVLLALEFLGYAGDLRGFGMHKGGS